MRDNEAKSSRRRILKSTAALSAITMLPITSGHVAARNGSKLNMDFDPTNENQIKEFADAFRNLSDEKQQKVFEELSSPQRNALGKAFLPTKVTTTVIKPATSTDGTISTMSTETHRDGKLSGYSYLGSHLWDWFHEVNWEHDGSSVSDVHSNDYATVYDSTWSYDGTKSNSLDVDTSEFVAFRQGSLSFLGGEYSATASPYARVQGFENGAFSVLDKDDGY